MTSIAVDLAIAAPSMKAALEAWGAGSNPFNQGIAKETDDPDVVAATMSKPGVVLKRPAGSNGRFAEHSDLPSDLESGENGAPGRRRAKPAKRGAAKAAPELSERDARKAAADFEKEQQKREAEARRDEAAQAKKRERRDNAVAKAQASLDQARTEHEAKVSTIEAQRAALDKRTQDEEARWEKQRKKLEDALRRAHQL